MTQLDSAGPPCSRWVLVCSVGSSALTEECSVPDAMVGLSKYLRTDRWNYSCALSKPNGAALTRSSAPLLEVIGRGGEQINKIQQESGCKVQFAHGELCTCCSIGVLKDVIGAIGCLNVFCICSQTLLAFQKEEFLSPGHQMPYSKERFPTLRQLVTAIESRQKDTVN